MVRLGYISIAIILVLSILLPGCSDSDIDPNITTYTTIEEQSSDIGSEGGEIQLGDGGTRFDTAAAPCGADQAVV